MTDRINNDIAGQAEAKRTEPANSEAYFRRGLAYKNDGDLAAAIEDFNEAIRLNPNNADAYFNRGIAHINNHNNYNDLDDLGKAVSDFTKAVRFNPNNTKAHNKRAAAYKKKENPVKESIPREITPRKATYNYLLTHRVIRDMAFSDPNLFKETILPHPQNLQRFLQLAVANAKKRAEGDPDCYESPYAIEQFEFGLYRETEGKDIIVVEIPNYEKALDCVQIAFPVTDEGVLYFTCELTDVEDGNFWPIVGQWDGRGTHYNYGCTDVENGQTFAGMVAEIVWGEGKNPVGVSCL